MDVNDLIPQELFERVDTTDDALFYDMPRFVTHVDEPTIAALTVYLDEVTSENDALLDLMSSWVSHLPEKIYRDIACVGMNAEELAGNERATEWSVQDLNSGPRLPYDSARFDHVIISFSVQYLIQPVAVFQEVGRILRPGGTLTIAMSHRCFPTKAIRAFHVLPPAERIKFVGQCVHLSGAYSTPEFIDRSPENADPLWIVTAKRH